MVLKIFTKRKTNAELVQTDMAWKDSYVEGSKIRMTPLEDRIDFYVVTNTGVSENGTIIKETHGYEIFNDAGVSIEKYVTVCKN